MAPVLAVSGTAGPALRITFATEAGRAYSIQSRTALESASWSPVGSPVTGTGGEVSVEVPTTTEALFLRVTVQ
jgi:hypothetical protein